MSKIAAGGKKTTGYIFARAGANHGVAMTTTHCSGLTVRVLHEVQRVSQQRQPFGPLDLAGQLVELFAGHPEVDVPQNDGRREQIEEQVKRGQHEQWVHALHVGRHPVDKCDHERLNDNTATRYGGIFFFWLLPAKTAVLDWNILYLLQRDCSTSPIGFNTDVSRFIITRARHR